MRISKEEFRETMLRLLAQRREVLDERRSWLALIKIDDKNESEQYVNQLTDRVAANGYLEANRIG